MAETKIHTVTLPDIGEGVVEGEVIQWLKSVGDSLAQDEPVVIVMTDKATVELPAPYPGKLAKQYYAPGEKAILDRPLYDIALIGAVDAKGDEKGDEKGDLKVEKVIPSNFSRTEVSPVKQKKASEISNSQTTSNSQTISNSQTTSNSHSISILATPSVRHLAKELGVDLNQISGTGKGGRIEKEDILREVHQFQTKDSKQSTTKTNDSPQLLRMPDDEEVPLIGIKALMAKKMAESKGSIPHFSYYEQVEVSRLIQLRANVKREGEQEGIHVTFVPFFVRALSLTAKDFPIINSSVDMAGQKIFFHKHHHIGIAMSSKHGLIVPVLKDVESMSFRDIVEGYERLKMGAMEGKLSGADMKGGTISLSNFGTLGSGLWASPIINPPEVAILAVNKIQKQVVVKNGGMGVEDVLNLSWSFDHRIIDGDLAARVSHRFAMLLRDPALLL